MKKWEYHIVKMGIDGDNVFDVLNTLGKWGWELCSTLYLDMINIVVYIFKRELQDERKDNNPEQ